MKPSASCSIHISFGCHFFLSYFWRSRGSFAIQKGAFPIFKLSRGSIDYCSYKDIGRFDASRKKEISPPSRVLVYTPQPLINYITIVR